MRTTIRLDDRLLEAAKKQAAREGKTLTALIDQALRQALARAGTDRTKRKRVRLPVSRAGGGTLPGVDLNDSASLMDIMEVRK